MVKVVFTETQHVRNARKTVYEKDHEYDLPEASVQRWEGIGVVLRVNDVNAKEQSKTATEKNQADPFRVVKAGMGKFNVFTINENGSPKKKMNEKPLTEREANDMVRHLKDSNAQQEPSENGASEEQEKDDDQKA